MLNSTVSQFFTQAISHAMDSVRSDRDCNSLPDKEFVFTAIRRVIGQFDSGRDLLQTLDQQLNQAIPRSTFFDALHSKRRLRMVDELAHALEKELLRKLCAQHVDFLAQFPQLADFDVFAGDGHAIAHACHAPRRHDKDFVAAKNLFLLDLRSGLLRALAPVGGFDASKPHEWPIFKRALPPFLKSRSRRCLFILDRAFIDNHFWSLFKTTPDRKACVITRMREDMKPVVKVPRPFEATLSINTGVTGDFLAGFNNEPATLRIVEYINPETGEAFAFLTSDDSLPPGLIAWLYLLRWTIEKLFDTLKHSLHQTKAWATGEVAQRLHSVLLAMTHNLITAFQALLGPVANLSDSKCLTKYRQWIDHRRQTAQRLGRTIHPLLDSGPRIAQLSLQCIRTLRNFFDDPRPLQAILHHFQAALTAYL